MLSTGQSQLIVLICDDDCNVCLQFVGKSIIVRHAAMDECLAYRCNHVIDDLTLCRLVCGHSLGMIFVTLELMNCNSLPLSIIP